MKAYESVIVIDSLLKSEEIEAIIEKVERIINNNGGQIVEIDRWGKKRLAYEIKKRQYGYYVEFIFQGPGNAIQVLEREYGLDENILRYLTVHLNKRAQEHKERQKMTQNDYAKAQPVGTKADNKDSATDSEKEPEIKPEPELEAASEETAPAAEPVEESAKSED
ncbi:MAG: 30S ribosomal protein S6 [Calditrichaeota bacterium]|nr:30S ribosomal protein S6 [Calditrichota bacterium]